jgi:hypothetical protein
MGAGSGAGIKAGCWVKRLLAGATVVADSHRRETKFPSYRYWYGGRRSNLGVLHHRIISTCPYSGNTRPSLGI